MSFAARLLFDGRVVVNDCFALSPGERPGRVERLLSTNRLSGCYFSADACLGSHLGQNIDRLSLSMQSRSLEETVERQRGTAPPGGEMLTYNRNREAGWRLPTGRVQKNIQPCLLSERKRRS